MNCPHNLDIKGTFCLRKCKYKPECFFGLKTEEMRKELHRLYLKEKGDRKKQIEKEYKEIFEKDRMPSGEQADRIDELWVEWKELNK